MWKYWPFRRKALDTDVLSEISRVMVEELPGAIASRKALGVDPDGENWAVLLDIGKYMYAVAYLNQNNSIRQAVEAIHRLIVVYESEMDFDKTSIMIGMMAGVAFPPMDGEPDEDYNHRVLYNYGRYKAANAPYQGLD